MKVRSGLGCRQQESMVIVLGDFLNWVISTFLNKILKEFSMQDFKKRFMPMNHVLVLSKNQCFLKHMMSKGHMIGILYALEIGSIMLYQTQYNLCSMNDELWPCWGPREAVIRVLKYLWSTKDKFLVYGRISVKCYTKPIIQASQDRSQSKVFPEHSNRKVGMVPSRVRLLILQRMG